MFAPVRCCFDVMFLLFASLFALSVHQALLIPLTEKVLRSFQFQIFLLLQIIKGKESGSLLL